MKNMIYYTCITGLLCVAVCGNEVLAQEGQNKGFSALEQLRTNTKKQEHVHGPSCDHGVAGGLDDKWSVRPFLTLGGALGASNLNDDELADFQEGGHDPNQRGFSFNSSELAVSIAYLDEVRGELRVAFTDEDIEMEEAFIEFMDLTENLDLKLGLFLTDFSHSNTLHQHSRSFVDRGIVENRLLGSEGMRSAGVQLNYNLVDSGQSLSFAVQDSSHETMSSYRGEGHSHDDDEHGHEEEFEEGVGHYPYFAEGTRSLADLLYSIRWQKDMSLSEGLELSAGFSTAQGANHTGGFTQLYAIDAVVTNYDEDNAWLWAWENELIYRHYRASSVLIHEGEPEEAHLANDYFEDGGFSTQFIHRLDAKWRAGIRAEYLWGKGDSHEESETVKRQEDSSRADRYRFSPMVQYQFHPTSELTVQYNWDKNHAQDHTGHSLWLGFKVNFGSH